VTVYIYQQGPREAPDRLRVNVYCHCLGSHCLEKARTARGQGRPRGPGPTGRELRQVTVYLYQQRPREAPDRPRVNVYCHCLDLANFVYEAIALHFALFASFA
jgi:hypothetical protein